MPNLDRKKSRTWEKQNPVKSYYIPENLHEKAKDVRAKILGLAQVHMTTTSNVASALLGYSLAQVRQGKLEIEALPDINRRKMALTWEESDGDQSQEIQPIKKANKGKSKNNAVLKLSLEQRSGQTNSCFGRFYIHWRIGFIPSEVMPLMHIKDGRLKLKEKTITVGQKVSSAW